MMRRRALYKTISDIDAFTITITVAAAETFTLPALGTVDADVNWGDGSSEQITIESPTHLYTAAGDYQITVNGTMTGFSFNNVGSKLNLKGIDKFGSTGLTNVAGFAYGCLNCEYIKASDFDTSGVTSLFRFALNCRALTEFSGCENWDTSLVTTMQSFIQDCRTLPSIDVSNFNTSLVSSMAGFAQNCFLLTSLNVSGWNTSNVSSMTLFAYTCNNLTDIIGFESLNMTGCTAFLAMLQNTTLPTSRYNAVLNQNTGWASQTLNNGGGNSMHFGNSQYSLSDADAVAGRNIIQTTYNWTITDGGGI